LAACLLAGAAGCTLRAGAGPDPDAGRQLRILDFTLLGDTAVAVRFETRERIVPPAPDTAALTRIAFAAIDRRTGAARSLDSLPLASAPTFPRWFFACDSGRPVSVHPPGFAGPAGSCTNAYSPIVATNGYTVAFADSQARVNLFSRELELITFRATYADSAMPLEIRSGIGRVMILEWHGQGDTAEWRGFANDDPSGSDSVWLAAPQRVRVREAGIRLVCGASDAQRDSLACWRPDSVPGLAEALREAEGGDPEWSPATGELAYLIPPARIVCLRPATGARAVLDAGNALARLPP
jgi:hypothetical protein